MTRGRRPDPTLQPSRQLQTARAFRERKAAHLRSLEERVKEQDAEILQLKAKLGIEVPPSPTALDASITNGVTIKSSRDSPAPHVPSNAGQEEIKPSVKRLKRESSSSDGGSSPPCSNCAHMSEKMTKLVRFARVTSSDQNTEAVKSSKVCCSSACRRLPTLIRQTALRHCRET